MKIVVIMPACNEADNIGSMIDCLFNDIFPAIPAFEMHLVVVDDESSDGTKSRVQKKMAHHSRIRLLNGKNAGLGHAYVQGMRYAMDRLGAAAVVEMDADFQHDPKYLILMAANFADGADYVIGSRFIAGGSIPAGWAWHRKLVSTLGNALACRMLKLPHVHDFTTGLRLTRVAGMLDRIDLESLMALDRFAFKVDLLCRIVALGAKTVEIPIHFGQRRNERSKFNFKEIVATLSVVVRLRLSKNLR